MEAEGLINWPTERYSIIVIDPPWEYAVWSAAGSGRSASQHYAVQSSDWIANLPIRQLAEARRCLLFCWLTWPLMPQGLACMQAWGFTYKTVGFVWVKQYRSGGYFMGNGYYTRSNTEICVLATMGSGPFLPTNRGVSQIVSTEEPETIITPIMRHSQKPAEVQRRIEAMYPNDSYLELFARRPRPGWWSWGNEIPGHFVYTPRQDVAQPEQLQLIGG